MDSGAFLAAIDGDRKQTEAYQRFAQLERQERLALWTTWGHIGDGFSGSVYSGLIAGARVARALTQPGWDVRIEGHRPGFSESYGDGKRQVSYEAIGSEGVEPLVHVRLPVEG